VAKLLIDECLHTSLLELAHAAGHIADHVTYLGLGSSKDWELAKLIVERDYSRGEDGGVLPVCGGAERAEDGPRSICAVRDAICWAAASGIVACNAAGCRVCMLFRAHMHAPAPIPWISRMERRRSEVRSMWSSSPMTNGKKAVPPGNLTLRPRYRHRRLENNRTAEVPIKALSPAMLWASTSASSPKHSPRPRSQRVHWLMSTAWILRMKAMVASKHDRLRPRPYAQFVENVRGVIADCSR
jgi:hypothetical protein